MKREFDCVETSCVICGSNSYKIFAEGKDYEYGTSDRIFTFVICSVCSHVYLNPRPAEDCLHLAYSDDYYTVSGRHTSGQSKIIASFKSFVIKQRLRFFEVLLKGKARILEVGCGDGSLLMDMKTRNPALDITGLDMTISGPAADRCKTMGIAMVETPIEKADLIPESFDLIIMNQVIEHVLDPVEVMRRLSRSLKPGGYISIETPDREGYDRAFFRKSYWGGYYFPRHLHLFDMKGLRSCVQESGLDVVFQGHLLAPIIWVFSIHALLCNGLERPRIKEFLSRLFSDRNPITLSVFTIVDLFARMIGLHTSNQKIIARK